MFAKPFKTVAHSLDIERPLSAAQRTDAIGVLGFESTIEYKVVCVVQAKTLIEDIYIAAVGARRRTT